MFVSVNSVRILYRVWWLNNTDFIFISLSAIRSLFSFLLFMRIYRIYICAVTPIFGCLAPSKKNILVKWEIVLDLMTNVLIFSLLLIIYSSWYGIYARGHGIWRRVSGEWWYEQKKGNLQYFIFVLRIWFDDVIVSLLLWLRDFWLFPCI